MAHDDVPHAADVDDIHPVHPAGVVHVAAYDGFTDTPLHHACQAHHDGDVHHVHPFNHHKHIQHDPVLSAAHHTHGDTHDADVALFPLRIILAVPVSVNVHRT